MESNEWRFNRIVVGVDGSAGATRAMAWAIQQAKRTGAEIVAVYVGQPPYIGSYGFVAPVPLPDWQDEARGLFAEEWCLPLRNAGVRYRPVFQEGNPGPELIAIADKEGAGLIVTGSRGLGAVREAILGSVSHYLTLHSEVPVVVVPAERRVREKAAELASTSMSLTVAAGVPS